MKVLLKIGEYLTVENKEGYKILLFAEKDFIGCVTDYERREKYTE